MLATTMQVRRRSTINKSKHARSKSFCEGNSTHDCTLNLSKRFFNFAYLSSCEIDFVAGFLFAIVFSILPFGLV
jgi:hypothetical protein